MVDHVRNRDLMLQVLWEELVGPSPQGDEIDCTGDLHFSEPAEAARPRRQLGSGEEILLRDTPTKRYGVGVLYPRGQDIAVENAATPEPGTGTSDGDDGAVSESTVLSDDARQGLEEVARRAGRSGGEHDTDDFDLAGAQAFRPSSMGISFLAEFPSDSRLVVEATQRRHDTGRSVNGRYLSKRVFVGDRERKWWLRRPVALRSTFDGHAVCAARGRVGPSETESHGLERMKIQFEVFVRPHGPDHRQQLVTVCLVNREEAGFGGDESCLFQAYFRATVETADGTKCILPYPVGQQTQEPDEEEASIGLLYRDFETFAVGHGCAAGWEEEPQGRTAWITAEVLPTYETRSITPDIPRPDGTVLQVPMAPLAGLIPDNDGFAALEEVLALYEKWITTGRNRIPELEPSLHEAAYRNISQCERALDRMRDGLVYLRSDSQVLEAFRLANHAILQQQIRSTGRPLRYDSQTKRLGFSVPYQEPDPLHPPKYKGTWRAFQIAFLLMGVRSAGEDEAPDRETVELIWFPTGGGKTEAYLGLAAFAMFLRRLRNPEDDGVHVLMRYTLRLLTAQQFQRAAGLICAMEYFRAQNPGALGNTPFSIGIWLGGSTTPNTRERARKVLRGLKSGDSKTENEFLLTRCPWCGGQIGPVEYAGRVPNNATRVVGYTQEGDSVVLHCYDTRCRFRNHLPVYVVDEEIYLRRPTLVIGTVDKFAMLAWRPEARSLFGRDPEGRQRTSPPGLIIQDELHLIAGPLGSMVGLFETVIEELCTDRRDSRKVKPKIVCATATIRRYEHQIKALYARTDAALFPPPGLDASDSFFSQYAREQDGSYSRGRVYVGIHAPGLGSMQTVQVRTFSALLQAPVTLTPEERDPWWSVLLFFNSLRELGTTLTLFQSDIPDYFKVLKARFGLDYKELRSLRHVMELTSRLKSDEVPAAIQDLMAPCAEGAPVDVCLASNIIEVGVDIDRLSLMAVVGQPKTTAQYIQVTGRVGRRWFERPGLVTMLYGASKPRDRSHFEKFRTYHERLYAQVEPTSVTPFSPPVLDRALHAVMVAYARQAGNPHLARSPHPFPAELLERMREILLPRVEAVDPDEVANFERVFRRRAAEWRDWERTHWSAAGKEADTPMLRAAGAYTAPEDEAVSWSTPMSLRNVDAECQAEITRLYLGDGGEGDA